MRTHTNRIAATNRPELAKAVQVLIIPLAHLLVHPAEPHRWFLTIRSTSTGYSPDGSSPAEAPQLDAQTDVSQEMKQHHVVCTE
jgi:hypothetical protein